MADTETQIVERGSVLDAFAGRAPQVPAVRPQAAGGTDVFGGRGAGAQAVAVYRDEREVLQKLKALASAAGDDWYYRFPVKNRADNRTDYIEGPSIKLANDLARMYGNCEVDTRVMDLGDEWLIYARFTDFESGYVLTRPFQQRKNASKMGGADDARRLDIAFQIGVSKAIRNVVTNALQTFADFAFAEAKNALVDKIGHRLDDYRRRTNERLSARLDIRRVEAVIGRISGEWLAPDIARIIAMMKSVEDGMATLDETFPPLVATGDVEAGKSSRGEGVAVSEPAKDDATGRASEEAGQTGGVGVAQPASSASAPDQGSAPAGAAGGDARAQLVAKLEAAADKSERALKLALGGLTAAELAIITDADRETLTQRATAAAAARTNAL